jgi:hypothetical protein
MIQLNLLPDVKLDFIKARRTKRLVILISSVLALVSLVVFIALLGYTDIIQKHHLNTLSANINIERSELNNISNLDKILTVQNQLTTLPTLDAEKPAATRLFQDLVGVTPAAASISQISVNFSGSNASGSTNSMEIEGNADSLTTVNQYVDTLKFTTYSDGSSAASSDAFSDVVLSSFGLQTSTGASYTISLNFNPVIFDISKSITLHVPANMTTTRSITQLPTDLFQKISNTNGGE